MKKTTRISFCLFLILSWLPFAVWALEPPFDNTSGALKSAEIVPGKQIALWALNTSVSDRWFSRENNNDKKRSATLTDYCTFIVEAADNNEGIVLKRKADMKYMKRGSGIEWAENKSEAVAFEVAHPGDDFNYTDAYLNAAPAWDPGYATYLVRFTPIGSSGFLNANDNSGFATGIGSWSAFLVYDMQSGLKAEALENFQDALEQAGQYPLGEGLGQYQDPENTFKALVEEASGLNPEEISVEELEIWTVRLQEAIPTLALNMPQTGRFYRIRNCWNDKYIASYGTVNEEQAVAMVSEKDGKNSVFYLTEDNRLINSMVLGMERNLVGMTEGGSFVIEAHPEILGAYLISDLGHDNSTLYALADHLDWVDYDYRENNHCAWTLEEVADPVEQPVLVKELEGEYATLSAPVALNVPEGVEVYVVTEVLSEKNELQTVKLTDKIIPAATPVLLKRTSLEQSFSFTFAQGGIPVETVLVSNYVESALPESVNAYVLADGEQGFCFYRLGAADRMVSGHSAYLVMEDAETNVFYLDQETTGVDSVETVVKPAAQREEYYDLQGRRVLKPVKGIYVTRSGKKVAF